MEKYIDLLRVIIKKFNIDNNSEFDDIIKEILNKYFINTIIYEMKYLIIILLIINHIALIIFTKNTIFVFMC